MKAYTLEHLYGYVPGVSPPEGCHWVKVWSVDEQKRLGTLGVYHTMWEKAAMTDVPLDRFVGRRT